ncbi:AI-2E family transporter [Dehalococcoidia bacterium]|nr:AI-2E family transporter [Dehalococcoidia bacterium]
MTSEKILDISWGTIFKVFVVVLCLYILYQVRDILILFIFALIISILFTPVIDFLTKLRIPRVLAVVFVYLGFFGIISILIYLVIPLFIDEIHRFSQVLPYYFDKIVPPLRGLGVEAFKGFEDFIALFGKTLEEMAATIFGALFAVFGGIFATIFVLTIAIFLSLEEKGMEKTLSLLSPKKYEVYVSSLWSRCQSKVSGWFFSRILGCLFVGVVCFFAFYLIDIKYPFSLGLMAGILNFIPIIGPLISGAVIFIVVALENLFQAIFILIIFILIQQVENNIITPVLAKKFIGLSPVLVLLALAIGGTLWGFLGAILAIPLAGILFEFFKEFLQKQKKKEAVVL